MTIHKVLLAACLLVAQLSFAAELTGLVVGVSDGDTITVLVDKTPYKIRLAGIDAPESRQAFGDRSRQNMASMVAGKEVTADCHKTDRYVRQICKVWVQPADCSTCGKTLDVGQAQIIAGMAWWYREYAKEQSAEDRGRYESEEQEAKARKRGLWADPKPVPPWEWRRVPKSSSQQPNPIQQVSFVNTQTVTTIDNFFQNLKRPTSPNNWLVAPADFVIKPDTIAPIFDVPVTRLREAFKATILQSKEIAVVAESENAMHLVATTSLMQFKDDVRVLFIPVASDKVTFALYSASRTGYWDLGTNRRRVEDLVTSIGSALSHPKK